MPSFSFASLAACLTLLLAASTNAQSAAAAAPGAISTLGCYSNAAPLVVEGTYKFQTAGYCQQQCAPLNKAVMAITGGSTCYCGDEIPAESKRVANSSCNVGCFGYGTQDCGGNGYWTVYLTGLTDDVPTLGGSSSGASGSSSTGSPSTTYSPTVVTQAGQTFTVTASSSADAGSPKGSSNKVAVAVGVVVGLLAVSMIVGGVVLFLKQRRRRAVEDEYQRNAAVSQFIAGKSEAGSTNDSRLDPSVMAARHQSIGSIADERDFSRRILQVRNPDEV